MRHPLVVAAGSRPGGFLVVAAGFPDAMSSSVGHTLFDSQPHPFGLGCRGTAACVFWTGVAGSSIGRWASAPAVPESLSFFWLCTLFPHTVRRQVQPSQPGSAVCLPQHNSTMHTHPSPCTAAPSLHCVFGSACHLHPVQCSSLVCAALWCHTFTVSKLLTSPQVLHLGSSMRTAMTGPVCAGEAEAPALVVLPYCQPVSEHVCMTQMHVF